MDARMRLCDIDGCERRHRAKGLCNVHYARRFRTGSVESAHRKGCDVDGCERKHKAHGFCSLHYYRLRTNGDPLVSQHRENCSICDQKHYARGFCYAHWNAWRGIQNECEPKPKRVPVEPLRPHLERWVTRVGDVEVANHLALTHGHIHHLLNRNKTVDLDVADRICLHLGLPFDALFNQEVA